ncbi:hypothetical protein PTSG_00140 [Salpingoeca rosetta]|uniref:SASH1/NUB1 homeodomain-like domain-containing protein n=1 Tax=Salpingoeca rosetta (strain ATCC 50818 / BSB-021) TaxID=946362 RepID=F2TVM6_SALR5|nr:uncharacterized protein PTSG_00140 [Salpingoeca rosetta]EGD72122.1 hypothetical protein PTSG_00140 [Salpingoeca rosetta]|eukprot:XP_004998694.1 hypothetical protein PTSG_00140 [Salpingoeca rosetta]
MRNDEAAGENGQGNGTNSKETVRITVTEETQRSFQSATQEAWQSDGERDDDDNEPMQATNTDDAYALARDGPAAASEEHDDDDSSNEHRLPTFDEIDGDPVLVPVQMPHDEKSSSHRGAGAAKDSPLFVRSQATASIVTAEQRHDGDGGGRMRQRTISSTSSKLSTGAGPSEEDASMMTKPLGAGLVDAEGYTIRTSPSPPAERKRRDSFYSSDEDDDDDKKAWRSLSIRESSVSSEATAEDVSAGVQELSMNLGPAPSSRRGRSGKHNISADPFGDISAVSGSPLPNARGRVVDPFLESTPLPPRSLSPSSGQQDAWQTPTHTRRSADFVVPKPSALAHMHMRAEMGMGMEASTPRPAAGAQQRKPSSSSGDGGGGGGVVNDPFAVDASGGDGGDTAAVLGFGDEEDMPADRPTQQQQRGGEGVVKGGEERQHTTATTATAAATAKDVEFVDVRKLQFLPTPLDEVPLDVLTRVKTELRQKRIKLWLLPYTDEHGTGHVAPSLIDDITDTVKAERRHVASAVEKLRVMAYNKKVLALQRKASMLTPSRNTLA